MINKIKKKIGKKNLTRGKNFGIYSLLGVVVALFTVTLMWFFIDILKFSTIIGSTIVTAIIFLFKYCVYLWVRLIKPSFIKYASTSIAFSIAIPVLMWISVDILHNPTVISSVIIVYGIFILRFITFEILGLIKNE